MNSHDWMTWLSAHAEFVGYCGAAVVLAVLRRHTPEEWVAYANQNPRWHGLLEILSAVGLDAAQALRGVMQVLTGKVAAKTATPPTSGGAS